jgi:hypothetical protein
VTAAAPALSPWAVAGAVHHVGGRQIVARHHAPLGRLLPYRRAAGQHPADTGGASQVRSRGWQVDLGDRGLGDLLLGLAMAAALAGITPDRALRYIGPRAGLLSRCALSVTTEQTCGGPHLVITDDAHPVAFTAVPEQPPTWLDLADDHRVEVHAALPMRYYLSIEQLLGVRLPARQGPTPVFWSTQPMRPYHAVFVSTTSRPDRKDYGPAGFAAIAEALVRRRTAPWTFSMITDQPTLGPAVDGIEVLAGLDATDCIDVFAAAQLVIGNDTGLTHLAALTSRPDGSGPQVVGLYGRHAHTKWITGSSRHHAVATPFSAMVAAADRCPVRDQLDDAVWSDAADLHAIPASMIAEFAGRCTGWW